jgi:hypothetical protein
MGSQILVEFAGEAFGLLLQNVALALHHVEIIAIFLFSKENFSLIRADIGAVIPIIIFSLVTDGLSLVIDLELHLTDRKSNYYYDLLAMSGYFRDLGFW